MQDAKNRSKIILIEDDSFLASMYTTKLSLEGFEVFHAADGKEGIDLIKEENPDLILLDIILPKIDGFEVLELLKQNENTKEIPVIVLTNLGKKGEVEKGKRLGAVDYLIKAHFIPSEVIEKIKKIIEKNN